MRIAIPLAPDNNLAEDFSAAQSFALYDIHDDTRAVGFVGRQALADPGCATTPGFLRLHGVEVILAHAVSQNAVNHLLEVGIVAIKDAPLLPADALIAHLVSGTLQATPPEVAMHEGGCQSGGAGGCGHCCGGEHAHADDHAHGPCDQSQAGPCAANPGECCG